MNSIFRTLEQILKDSEDYISHEAGLFFNGLLADLPQKLERTPVNLFQNDDDKQVWEGTLQLFYPKRLLGLSFTRPDVSLADDLADWMRLRSNQRFAAYAMRCEWLPIAGDTRKKPLELLEAFFAEELSRLVADDLTGLLEQMHRQAGRLDEAVRLLNKAASLAAKAAMRDSAAAILSALGNVHLARGELTQARKSYLKAAAHSPRDCQAPIIANIQTNLGLVEFRSGNLKKADCCFSLAAKSQKLRNNLQGEITSGIMLGRIKLARGQMLQAIYQLREVERLQSLTDAVTNLREIRASIALAYELLGNPVSSDQYWKKVEKGVVEKATPPAEFMISLFKGLHSIIRGNLPEAEKIMAETALFGKKSGIQAAEVAVAKVYRALIIHFQGCSEAVQLFRQLPPVFLKTAIIRFIFL